MGRAPRAWMGTDRAGKKPLVKSVLQIRLLYNLLDMSGEVFGRIMRGVFLNADLFGGFFVRAIFPGGREATGGWFGWNAEARGFAIVLAVVAVVGLACGGIEALGVPLRFVRWPGPEQVVVNGVVGAVRMGLLGGALALLVVWAGVARPRGRRADRAASAAAGWVLLVAAVLTFAGVWRLLVEAGKTFGSVPGL